MTEDELKQEAEKWLRSTDNHLNEEKTHFLSESEYAERAYLASAEPREKRIAELERKLKVETELNNRLGLAYREYEELTKEQDEHLAELEKENADLKELFEACKQERIEALYRNEQYIKEIAELKGIKDVATLIRANNDTVITLMQLNNKLVSKSQQLTKAIELLKQFLKAKNSEDTYKAEWEAEQFINEVEK